MSDAIFDSVEMTPSLLAAEPGRVIDPANLTLAQRSGMRCVYANCQRALIGPKTFIGSLPDNSPLFACDDHEAVEQ